MRLLILIESMHWGPKEGLQRSRFVNNLAQADCMENRGVMHFALPTQTRSMHTAASTVR